MGDWKCGRPGSGVQSESLRVKEDKKKVYSRAQASETAQVQTDWEWLATSKAAQEKVRKLLEYFSRKLNRVSVQRGARIDTLCDRDALIRGRSL